MEQLEKERSHAAALEVAALDLVVKGVQQGLRILLHGGELSLQNLMEELEQHEFNLLQRMERAHARYHSQVIEPWDN